MTAAKIVIPADDPPLIAKSSHFAEIQQLGSVTLYNQRPTDAAELIKRLKPADVLLHSRSSIRLPAEVLNELTQLKMIAVCGIGYDSIDLQTAHQNGITVSNVPGKTATVVAEHAFTLMLSVARRIAPLQPDLRRLQWPDDPGVSLVNKQIGIVGTGNIGRRMIQFCRAFGMKVVAWSFHPDEALAKKFDFEYVDFDHLIETSDVISLHVRLSEQTKRIVGREQIQQMKPGAIVVNTARGKVVDNSALAEAIQSGHLFGAGIDVFETEPITAGDPLLACDNVVLTPHSADQTPEGIDALALGCLENIRAFLNGRPQNVVSQ